MKIDNSDVKVSIFIYICCFFLLMLFVFVVPDVARYSMCDVNTEAVILEREESSLASPVSLYNYTVKFRGESGDVLVGHINASYLKYDKGEIVNIVYQSDNKAIVKFESFLNE